MNPLVTIVIPIYKVEKFIERCLQSVVNQSYKNTECILVNDVSPDRSMEIATNFIEKNPFFDFKIINQPENKGLSMARNAGMDIAKGKYIYFLDSDDEILPETITRLVETAEENKAEITLGQSICINEEEGWERNYFPITNPENSISGNANILERFVDGKYPVMACDKLVRMDFLMKHRLYFVQDLFSQDVLWSFQSALKAEKIAFLRENTYLYYFHPASIIHNRGDKHFRNWITIAEYINEAYIKEKNPESRKLILKYLIDFKSMTLEMNWKAQKNEELWKRSYRQYRKLASLPLKEYWGKNFTSKDKKKDFFCSLPTNIGFRLFKYRYQR
ncbi:MAG: glycosyltransferase [Cloacibacterium sp.]|nr:glycosyltransferase [Cloacibacterium sp.]